MGQTQNIEQQIQLLSNLQLGFGIAALLFLALAIFLFFYLHIPQVFNEYRGKSAQKAMEEMAANSSDSGRIVSMDKKSKNKKKGQEPVKDELGAEIRRFFFNVTACWCLAYNQI